ncbi:MAG: TIGR04219 family outer membrane beta-barrel protein [Campylobacterota bacterium]
MKKILTTLAVGAMLATAASADLSRVEMGVGAWNQTPSGETSYVDAGDSFADVSKEEKQTEGYLWMLIKHPIPIVPNIRLEYVSAVNEGEYIVETGTPIGTIATGSLSKLEMTQIDIIPYYNILDNTGWMTVDLGVDFKVIDIEYSANGVDILEELNVDIASIVVPLGYLRARVEIPGTNLGLEADVKYVSYDSDTISDIRVKADYTLDFIPIVQPAIEIGYRVQTFDIEDSGLKMDTEYKGVYAGLMVRF